MDLLYETMARLRSINDPLVTSSDLSNVPLPRYDKALHAGKGDRAPVDSWNVTHGIDNALQVAFIYST
jgi:pantothenate kinase-related protein Tda10